MQTAVNDLDDFGIAITGGPLDLGGDPLLSPTTLQVLEATLTPFVVASEPLHGPGAPVVDSYTTFLNEDLLIRLILNLFLLSP